MPLLGQNVLLHWTSVPRESRSMSPFSYLGIRFLCPACQLVCCAVWAQHSVRCTGCKFTEVVLRNVWSSIPVWLCIPVYYSILQYTTVYSSILQYTPVYSSILQCTSPPVLPRRLLSLWTPSRPGWRRPWRTSLRCSSRPRWKVGQGIAVSV